MAPTHDFHVHSTYSDGSHLEFMVAAASEAGLDGVGFADHLNVSTRPAMRHASNRFGFTLDLTYERRRQAIESIRERFDVDIYDAVEVDYDPRDEAEIRAFLDEADFDYAVGSVHYLDGRNVHEGNYYRDLSEGRRAELVDTYFDRLVALVESDLFDVVAHIDLVERTDALRGFATTDHYERVATALVESRSVPEINAGRALGGLGEFHPTPDFLDVLLAHGVEFTVGSDAHAPGELVDRTDALGAFLDERGIEPISVLD